MTGAGAGRRGVICAGNWIVDIVHEIDRWPNESELVRIGGQTRGVGGGAANVVMALAKLETGLPLFPVGAIGDDEHGAFIIEECRALGLSVSGLVSKTGVATAHTHVMSAAGRSRTFFYQGGANDALGVADFPPEIFAAMPARLFYLGYLTLLGELDAATEDGSTHAARLLDRASREGLTTCVDLVSIHHPGFRPIVECAAPFVDYLITNEIEAALASDSDPAADVEALLQTGRSLLGLGVRKAVVIHCSDRAVWLGADGTELVVEIAPLPPEKIASTLGAGDAFCAGLLYAIHEGQPPDSAIRLANTVARASLRGLTATSAIPPLQTLRPGTDG